MSPDRLIATIPRNPHLLAHHPLPVPRIGGQVRQAEEAVDPGVGVGRCCGRIGEKEKGKTCDSEEGRSLEGVGGKFWLAPFEDEIWNCRVIGHRTVFLLPLRSPQSHQNI